MPIVQPRHHPGDRHTANAANPHVPRRRALARSGFRTLIAVTVLGLVLLAVTTPPAQAAATCTRTQRVMHNGRRSEVRDQFSLVSVGRPARGATAVFRGTEWPFREGCIDAG